MTYVVALTGGIGSGKTVVSDYFNTLGVPVVDTDIIARHIVEPDQPALQSLVNTFGKTILKKDKTLDRAQLRAIAFSDPQQKAALDAITHPAIYQETITQITKTDTPYCIVVIPLLTADSPFNQFIQRVLTVTAKNTTKLKRVQARSGLSVDEVEQIMVTQLSDEERALFADDVIKNEGTLADVQARVEQLHALYWGLGTHKT